MAKLLDIVKPGVLTGEDVQKVFAYAKEHGFALPAVNSFPYHFYRRKRNILKDSP